jgi:hypothetical protein
MDMCDRLLKTVTQHRHFSTWLELAAKQDRQKRSKINNLLHYEFAAALKAEHDNQPEQAMQGFADVVRQATFVVSGKKMEGCDIRTVIVARLAAAKLDKAKAGAAIKALHAALRKYQPQLDSAADMVMPKMPV